MNASIFSFQVQTFRNASEQFFTVREKVFGPAEARDRSESPQPRRKSGMYEAVPVFIDEPEPTASASAAGSGCSFPEPESSEQKSDLAGKCLNERRGFLESMLNTSDDVKLVSESVNPKIVEKVNQNHVGDVPWVENTKELSPRLLAPSSESKKASVESTEIDEKSEKFNFKERGDLRQSKKFSHREADDITSLARASGRQSHAQTPALRYLHGSL